MTDALAAIATVALIAAFIAASWWYFRRIGTGKADPIINPSWTSPMRPASPPPPLHDPHPDDRP